MTRHDVFSRLFAESRPALKRYVRRLVWSRETAEEIVQEAFLRPMSTRRTADLPMGCYTPSRVISRWITTGMRKPWELN